MAVGIGPQIGFLFPVGDYQGYLNIKGYKDLAVENRAEGWSTWITFAITPKAPEPSPSPSPSCGNTERATISDSRWKLRWAAVFARRHRLARVVGLRETEEGLAS